MHSGWEVAPQGFIFVNGAGEHNLKDIDVTMPGDKLVASFLETTGPKPASSGAGAATMGCFSTSLGTGSVMEKKGYCSSNAFRTFSASVWGIH